jgi:peroxiredoxin (alkyl hydroperoxide reductase subunit C)
MFLALLVVRALAFSSLVDSSSTQPRKYAPAFKGTAVVGSEFKVISNDDYEGKYLVLLFYPFDFTFVCPTEIISFSEAHQQFAELGVQVIGISVDSHHTHMAWTKTPREHGGVGRLNFPLLSDMQRTISRAYRVLVEDEEDELNGAALRGLYIIDGQGKIRSVQVNDAPVGRSVDETLRLIKAFKYTDEHGEVCPANWTPGSETIIPDHDAKNSYFSKAFGQA